jgi:hypothetical protein
VVHSDRANHVYLNPLSDSRIRVIIRPRWCVFATGGDEVWTLGGETKKKNLTGDGKIVLSRTFVAGFTGDKKSRRDVKFVKWLVRKNRVLSMSKKDDELKVTDGTYNLFCVEVIFKIVNQIQTWGDERIKKIVAVLDVEGIKMCKHHVFNCI